MTNFKHMEIHALQNQIAKDGNSIRWHKLCISEAEERIAGVEERIRWAKFYLDLRIRSEARTELKKTAYEWELEARNA